MGWNQNIGVRHTLIANLKNRTKKTLEMKKLLFTFLILIFFFNASVVFAGATGENPVTIGNARFTFVNEGLVRLEYALDRKFVNDSTLFAVNRNTSYTDIKVTDKGGDKYTLTTPLMRIEYFDNGFPFGQTNIRVYFTHKGKEKSWLISHETKRGNLRGAIETLDAISSPVELQEGLLSREGWYTIHDTNKEILKNGWVQQRDPDHLQDIYLFVYGDDYKSALKSLQAISGTVPMTRKYVHGSWYCRWWNYTADDYRQLVREYKEHDFPLDIMVFDMGWHTQKQARVGTGHAGNPGWTGYSWNRELIPDPKGLIQEFQKDGIYVVLNEHPHDGIRDHDDMYPGFMHAMGERNDEKKNLIFDAGNEKYMKNFMHYAHNESDDMGVAFWWLDWQQDYIYPVVRPTTMKHLPWLNHIYYKYSEKNGLRGAGFSRWAGWGDHRHPIQFSGDAVGNWEMLKFEIELTATSGNAGCFFWAHDLGGFYGGKDPELYTRWTQFGLLNSSLRVHSVLDKDLDRRPWLWGAEYESAMRKIYHMRSQLMPYIYSSVRQCHTDMLPLNRAMYIDYNQCEESYNNPQQFMFGDLLLGAPVVTPRNKGSETATQKVWLPASEIWFNWFTGERFEGGQVIETESKIDEFPLFVKGGYPVPMQPYTQRMATDVLSELIVRVYPGELGKKYQYSLYEDDGISTQYELGIFAETLLETEFADKQFTIRINPAEGKYDGQLSKRTYRIELPETANKKFVVTQNGKKVTIAKDNDINGYILLLKNKNIRENVVIVAKEI